MGSEATRLFANIKGSGISFALSQEERSLGSEVERLARSVVSPGAVARDREARFDPEIWRELAAFGLTGIGIPTTFGGSGAGVLSTCLALEAFQKGGGDSGLTFSLALHLALCAFPIWLFGTEEQRKKYLPRLCSGEWVGGYAVSEPAAGSDVTALETTASRVGDRYEVNGVKTFVGNGSIADVLLVLARTGSGAGPFGMGLTCLLIEPKTTPGVLVEDDLDTCGYRSCPVSRIRFERVSVPASNRLGEEGKGFQKVALQCFDWERSVMIAPVVGEMERSFDECVKYSLQRKVRRQPIASLQMIQDKIAEMRSRLEAAKWAVYRVAWLQDQGLPHDVEGPLAKHVVAEAAMSNAIQAVQIFGGLGYLRNSPVERTLRDAKLAAIGGGTQELQKLALAMAVYKEFQESQRADSL